MNEKNICPVILCGGSGTRLWPLSRKSLPKQFIDLPSKETVPPETKELILKEAVSSK